MQRVTRSTVKNRNISYQDRLRLLGLTMLETWRLCGDLIEVCKIFKLLDNIRYSPFLICQQHVRLDVKKIFLSYKSNRYMELSAWISIAMCNSGHIQETNRLLFKKLRTF